MFRQSGKGRGRGRGRGGKGGGGRREGKEGAYLPRSSFSSNRINLPLFNSNKFTQQLLCDDIILLNFGKDKLSTGSLTSSRLISQEEARRRQIDDSQIIFPKISIVI
jgi:hypothetical protein